MSSKTLYDIIIPHYGVNHLTEYCLDCLISIRRCSNDYRIIFVDNGSPEFDKIAPELNLHPHLLIRNSKNLGYVKAVNQALMLASAPYIVFLNNDTEAVPFWLENLREPLEAGAHLSGPRTTTQNSWQGRTPVGMGWEFLGADAMLAFFCTMFKKEVFEILGFLDEDFGAGFGDDDWFCYKAQHAGFRLALVRHLCIPHRHRSTFKEVYGESNILPMQQKNLALFRKKAIAFFNENHRYAKATD